MFLHELEGKNIHTAKKLHGICKGVAVRIKSQKIHYLYCENAEKQSFFLPVSTIKSVEEEGIMLKKMQPAPLNLPILSTQKPVYLQEGIFLGRVQDVRIDNWKITQIILEDKSYSSLCITALSDALLLKKAPPFPLGCVTKEGEIITRTLLKQAVKEGRLISLTTSLL